jgi:hypothetical protein
VLLVLGIVHFNARDLGLYAALPAAFAAAAAVSLDRRTITIAPDGVRVSGIFGAFGPRAISFGEIGHAEVMAEPAVISTAGGRSGGAGVVVRADFRLRTLRLWSAATEKFPARLLLAAGLDGAIDTQALLGSFRSIGIEAVSLEAAARRERPAGIPRIVVIVALGASMLAVFLNSRAQTASNLDLSVPEIECITMRPGDAFDVRLRSTRDLRQVQFSTTAFTAIKLPLDEIRIDRAAGAGGPSPDTRLTFHAALDPNRQYMFSVQDNSGAMAWSPFITHANRPEGTGCPPPPGTHRPANRTQHPPQSR